MSETQGQGPGTKYKEQSLAAALTVSLKISGSEKVRRRPFWYGDLNSGAGYNETARCPGSPLVFLEAVDEVGRENCRGFFIDKNANAVTILRDRYLVGRRNCQSYIGDNKELLPIIADAIRASGDKPHYAMGAILSDGNGYFGDSIPHEEIITFATEFPRIDLIFNLNIRLFQTGRGHIIKEKGLWPTKFWPHPRELPDIFPRKHWLVRQPAGRGHRFLLFVGRNFPAGDHVALGFHHLESDEGKRLLEDIDSSARAPAPNQAELFKPSDLPHPPAQGVRL